MEICQEAVKMAASGAIAYATEHPYALGAQVALTVVGFVPATVTGPVLGVIGFSPAGVGAGLVSLPPPPIYCFSAFP